MFRLSFTALYAVILSPAGLCAITLLILPVVASAQNISGRIEATLVDVNNNVSYQEKGTGALRPSDDGLAIHQAFLHGNFRLNKDWTFDGVVNAYSDGEQRLGITQAAFIYKPLSPNKVKYKARAGFFYPKLSLENTATAWLSPYTYTQSAINSWIGEELRVLGAEVSLYSSGRQRRSPWSWELNAGAYKGNDTTGTLLAWRGFATHDRQSLHNDKIQFANIPSIVNLVPYIPTPTYTEPFREIDGKWGVYTGAHLRYLRQSEARYYYYDNLADPLIVNQGRLYAWHTKFHSLSFVHDFNSNWRVLTHMLDGSTLMGDNAVYTDFNSQFVLLRYLHKQHQLSLRYELFKVIEDDDKPEYQNDSDGEALTISWRYQLSASIELGLEWHRNSNFVEHRSQVNEQVNQRQSQILAVFALHF
jgi:hypothetical protein